MSSPSYLWDTHQTGRTVNPLAYAFTGSNPVLPISPSQPSYGARLRLARAAAKIPAPTMLAAMITAVILNVKAELLFTSMIGKTESVT